MDGWMDGWDNQIQWEWQADSGSWQPYNRVENRLIEVWIIRFIIIIMVFNFEVWIIRFIFIGISFTCRRLICLVRMMSLLMC